MSIREVTYYQAICDGCEKEHDGDDYSAWSCADGAREAAFESDWVQVQDRLLCGMCQNCPSCGYLRQDLGEGYLVCEDCKEDDL